MVHSLVTDMFRWLAMSAVGKLWRASLHAKTLTLDGNLYFHILVHAFSLDDEFDIPILPTNKASLLFLVL